MCYIIVYCIIVLLALEIVVGFNPTVYGVNESDGMVEVRFALLTPPTGGAPQRFSLSFSTEDNTAGIIYSL